MFTREAHANSNTMVEIEALERSRRHMLVAVLIASTIWFAQMILSGLVGDGLPANLKIALFAAGMVGALAFMLLMFRFHRFQMRVHGDPALRERLNDERIQEVRREAIYRSWWVLVIAVALGVAVAPFVELPDQALLLTLMLVAVNGPIVFFLALDRD